MLPFLIVLAALPSPEPLRLADVIDQVLSSHPDLLAAKADVQAAEARSESEKHLEDPELKAEIWNAPASRPLAIDDAGTLMIGMRQSWEVRGTRAARAAVASKEAEMGRAQLEAKRRELVQDASLAFYDYLQATMERALHQEALDVARRTRDLAASAYGARAGTQAQTLQAERQVTSLHKEIFSIDGRIAAAQATLNVLLGRSTDASLPPPADEEPLVEARARSELEDVALAFDPDLAVARRSLERAELTRRGAEREAKAPRVMAGLDYWYNPHADRLHGLSAMVTLSLPSLGKRHPLLVTEREKEVEAATATVAAKTRDTRRGVAETYERFQAAQRTRALIEGETLPWIDAELQALQTSYASGGAGIADVLEAQRMQVETRMQALDAKVDALRERAHLAFWVGAQPDVPSKEDER